MTFLVDQIYTLGQDSYLDSNNTATNYGSSGTLRIGWDDTGKINASLRTVIDFDVSALPENIIIEEASLYRYVSVASTQALIPAKLRRLTSAWIEAETTWNDATSSLTWTTPGGDYVSTLEHNFLLSTVTGWISINSLNDLVSDALYQRSGLLSLILMRATESAISAWEDIDSSEGTNAPYLTLTYRYIGDETHRVNKITFQSSTTVINLGDINVENTVEFDNQTKTNQKTQSIGNSVAFGGHVVAENKLPELSNDIEFGQSVQASPLRINVQSNIEFGQPELSDGRHIQSVSNSITFDQVLDADDYAPELVNSVTFDSTVEVVKLWHPLVSSITFEGTVRHNIINASASSEVTFDNTVARNLFLQELSSSVTFGQTLVVAKTLSISLTTSFPIEHSVRNTQSESVGNSITFTSAAVRTETPSNVIRFVGIVSVLVVNPAANSITFDSTATYTSDRNFSLSNTVIFASIAIPELEAGNQVYAPSIGETEDSYFQSNPLPATSYQGIGTGAQSIQSTITLDDGVTTLELRSPEFGDTHNVQVHRCLNRTRSGQYHVKTKTGRPVQRVLNFQIIALTQAESILFREFLQDNLGKQITLTDWYNYTWEGIISNPASQIRELHTCNNAVELELIGSIT